MSITPVNIERNERREIWMMLDRLQPRQRVKFLRQQCAKASKNDVLGVQVTGSSGLTNSVYMDCCFLALQYNVDLEGLADDLYEFIRQR